MKRKLFCSAMILLAALTMLFFSSCNRQGTTNNDPEGDSGKNTANKVTITLNGDSATSSDTSSATVEGTVITIVKPGEYTVSGKLTDGQIVVSLMEKKNVYIILNGVEIHCSTSAPLYVKECKNLILTLADGTVNTLTDAESYVFANVLDTEPSAAIFSKEDLKINGNGELNVVGSFNNGIASKDSLVIESGKIHVTAANNGLKGKDDVTIKGGDITVECEKDAVKSDRDNDLSRGYVEITGGTLLLKAGDEGIQAETNVRISGGTVTIQAEGNGIKAKTSIEIKEEATVDITTPGDGLSAAAVTGSATVNGEKQEG